MLRIGIHTVSLVGVDEERAHVQGRVRRRRQQVRTARGRDGSHKFRAHRLVPLTRDHDRRRLAVRHALRDARHDASSKRREARRGNSRWAVEDCIDARRQKR
jgi:hypothetical protein